MGRHGIVGASLLAHGKARLRAAIAGLTALAMVLAMAVVGAFGSTVAHADPISGQPSWLTAEMQFNPDRGTHNGKQIVQPNDTVTLLVQHDSNTVWGSTIAFELGNALGATFDSSQAYSDPGVKSVTVDSGQKVTIEFKDSAPSMTPPFNQGVVGLTFKITQMNSGAGSVPWSVGGAQQGTLDLLVVAPGDCLYGTTDCPSATPAKTVSGNWNSYVSIDNSDNFTVSTDVIGKTVTYTLTAATGDTGLTNYTINDFLPANLSYVSSSFEEYLTTWDSDDIPGAEVKLDGSTTPAYVAPTISAGTFSLTFSSLPAKSKLRVTYKVEIKDDTARAELQTQLQWAYDAAVAADSSKKIDHYRGGSYYIDLENTATFGATTKRATVGFGTSVGQATDPSAAFGKSSNWNRKNITVNSGAITQPLDIAYTFKVNLSQWSSSGGFNKANQNVVITDTLPGWGTWKTGTAPTISAGTLIAADAPCVAAAEFSDDACVGRYKFVGQELVINVGKNSATDVTISAQATISTTSGMTSGGSTPGCYTFTAKNTATFTIPDKDDTRKTQSKSATVTLVDRTGGAACKDATAFTKSGPSSIVKMNVGESKWIDYTLKIAAVDDDLDTQDMTIVDEADTNVFDLSDVSAIEARLKSASGYGPVLKASDYTLSRTDDKLTIGLSSTGKTKVGSGSHQWSVVLSLPTHPFVEPQELQITNKATLYSNGSTPLYWSDAKSDASSFGDYAVADKDIYTPDGWTKNVRAEIDGDAGLVQDTYVYRVQFIPHGAYIDLVNGKITDVVDTLSSDLTFVGFVDEANVASPAGHTSTSDKPLGHNVTATWNGSARKVTMTVGSGKYSGYGPTVVYFVVKINSFTAGVPIENSVGRSSTTITPSGSGQYPLSISKEDATFTPTGPDDPSPIQDDEDARFQLRQGGTVVVDDIFICGGQLRVGTSCADAKTVMVSAPGTYQLYEIVAPKGYLTATSPVTVTVAENGRSAHVDFYNTPRAAGSVGVGDYVWFDTNSDGIQGSGEPGIPGVVLTITGPECVMSQGKVVDVDGNPVGPQTTDVDGKYWFANLPILPQDGCGDDQHYTVTIDQAASAVALSKYIPTKENAGDESDSDRHKKDSSTWTSKSVEDLSQDGNEDPTLDFGFVLRPVPPAAAKSYAVGDYTWIDSNKNGVQDAGEPVLPGVKVELLDATGGVVATTTTNAQGRYLFDELPAGTYQIRFTLTPAQAVMYSFTKADQGSDAKDSDANQATGLTATFVLDDSNTALTKTYAVQTVKATEGIDPTWDAGVITAPSVSVGDYVWYDANGNGRQDAGEPGIEGVTLCLVGPDGGPVIHIHGNPVKPVQTDRDGKYTFDDLPVLSNGGTYTVCIDKAASKHALENYVPTKDGVGDRVKDSSTWTASTQKGDLTKDGQRDSTLDFGFVRIEVQGEAAKTYAVGDYVWIDTTYNAIQDRGEPVLAGVTVELLNAKGKVLATTKTDAKGRYLFDGLSAGTYQIRFRLTDAQAAKYAFVPANRGSDDAIDSDGVANASGAVAITAKFRLDDSNTALTKTYFRSIAASQGIDPTWDAGVVGIDVLGANQLEPLPGDTEVIPADGDIAYTGVPAWTMLTVALLLLAGGGALLLGARRRRGTR